MLIEIILFGMVSLILFAILFAKMLVRNNYNYVTVLVLQFIGITVGFSPLLFDMALGTIQRVVMYGLGIVLPLALEMLERKHIYPDAWLKEKMIQAWIQAGNSQKAKQVLLEMIDKQQHLWMAHRYLAQIYEKEGQLENATEEYIRAVEEKKDDFQSYYQIAFLLEKTNKPNEASTMLYNLLKKKPDYYEAIDLLGNILYDQEKLKEAQNVYLEGLRYFPADYALYYNLGMVCTRLNDFQKAKEYYEKAAQINSLLYNAKYNLGQLALLVGELEEAQQYFMQSLQGEEVEAGSYYYLSQINMLKGERDKALLYMNTAVEIEPELYEKMLENTIFIPIRNQVSKPSKVERYKKTMNRKEQLAKEHLENTYSFVGDMNNHDLKAMEQMKEHSKEKERE